MHAIPNGQMIFCGPHPTLQLVAGQGHGMAAHVGATVWHPKQQLQSGSGQAPPLTSVTVSMHFCWLVLHVDALT